jgi:hypothetical protein
MLRLLVGCLPVEYTYNAALAVELRNKDMEAPSLAAAGATAMGNTGEITEPMCVRLRGSTKVPARCLRKQKNL